MRDRVEARAETGRYGSTSDYVRDLIRRDQDRAGKLSELQKLIAEGIESGVSSQVNRRSAERPPANECGRSGDHAL